MEESAFDELHLRVHATLPLPSNGSALERAVRFYQQQVHCPLGVSLCVVGISANLLSWTVLRKKQILVAGNMALMVVCLCYMLISVAFLLILVTMYWLTPRWAPKHQRNTYVNMLLAVVSNQLQLTAHAVILWLGVLMALQRLVCITARVPIRRNRCVSESVTQVSIALIVLAVVVTSVPSYLVSQLVKRASHANHSVMNLLLCPNATYSLGNNNSLVVSSVPMDTSWFLSADSELLASVIDTNAGIATSDPFALVTTGTTTLITGNMVSEPVEHSRTATKWFNIAGVLNRGNLQSGGLGDNGHTNGYTANLPVNVGNSVGNIGNSAGNVGNSVGNGHGKGGQKCRIVRHLVELPACDYYVMNLLPSLRVPVQWIYVVCHKLLPCMLMMLLVGLLVRSLRHLVDRRTTLVRRQALTMLPRCCYQSEGDQQCRNRNAASVSENRLRQVNRHVTRMLIAIVLMMVATQLPPAVTLVWYPAEYRKYGDAFDILSMLNNTTSFILYCKMSVAFRKEFVRLLHSTLTFFSQQFTSKFLLLFFTRRIPKS